MGETSTNGHRCVICKCVFSCLYLQSQSHEQPFIYLGESFITAGSGSSPAKPQRTTTGRLPLQHNDMLMRNSIDHCRDILSVFLPSKGRSEVKVNDRGPSAEQVVIPARGRELQTQTQANAAIKVFSAEFYSLWN